MSVGAKSFSIQETLYFQADMESTMVLRQIWSLCIPLGWASQPGAWACGTLLLPQLCFCKGSRGAHDFVTKEGALRIHCFLKALQRWMEPWVLWANTIPACWSWTPEAFLETRGTIASLQIRLVSVTDSKFVSWPGVVWNPLAFLSGFKGWQDASFSSGVQIVFRPLQRIRQLREAGLPLMS